MTYNRTIFFDVVRKELFPSGMSQPQVDGMNALLDYIDDLEWLPTEEANQYFNYWNAYNFATTYHETAYTMQPIEEYGKGKGKKYGKPDSQTGQIYYGRGFVQMTWKTNYQRSDKEIADGDLISSETIQSLPEKKVNQTWHASQALNLEIASCNLMIGCWKGWYTGKKLWDYLRNDRKDYYNSRRIVNGLDKASKIRGHAQKFEKALVASWQSEPVEVPEPEQPDPMPDPDEPIIDPPSVPANVPDEIYWSIGDKLYGWSRIDD